MLIREKEYRGIVYHAHDRAEDELMVPRNAIVRAQGTQGSTVFAGEVVGMKTFSRKNILIFQPFVT